MTTPPRPHLRLVDGSRRDGDDGVPFDPVDRPVHDLHGAYHELGEGPIDGDDDDIVDADFARPAGSTPDDADGTPRTALQPRFVVSALIAFQLMAALGYVGKYVTLARGESVYAVAALLAAPASLCLYAGGLLLAWKPGRGRALFIAAAVGLGLAVPAWGIQYGWTWPMAFGAMLALAGAWYARPEIRPAAHEEAQP